MKKIIIFMAFAVLLISACSSQDSDAIKAKKIIEYHKKQFDGLPYSGSVKDGVREINVKALQYRWDPEAIVVKKGERIKLIVESIDAPHGFELEGIQIPGWDTDNLLKKGENVTLEFAADESGVWDLVCTGYCGPGHAGMRGKYIVKS